MKRLILITLVLATAVALRAAEVPDEADIRTMTEDSLRSFGQGLKDKDLSEFYDDIAVAWQKQITAEKLTEIFSKFFDKDIDLPAIVDQLEPVFKPAPAIDSSNDVLVIKGYYPTKPSRLNFQLKYLEEEGDWKLVGINIDIK